MGRGVNKEQKCSLSSTPFLEFFRDLRNLLRIAVMFGLIYGNRLSFTIDCFKNEIEASSLLTKLSDLDAISLDVQQTLFHQAKGCTKITTSTSFLFAFLLSIC